MNKEEVYSDLDQHMQKLMKLNRERFKYSNFETNLYEMEYIFNSSITLNEMVEMAKYYDKRTEGVNVKAYVGDTSNSADSPFYLREDAFANRDNRDRILKVSPTLNRRIVNSVKSSLHPIPFMSYSILGMIVSGIMLYMNAMFGGPASSKSLFFIGFLTTHLVMACLNTGLKTKREHIS